eukprot:scaffold310193_cov13-Tisochrysis_lutea.AAC.1
MFQTCKGCVAAVHMCWGEHGEEVTGFVTWYMGFKFWVWMFLHGCEMTCMPIRCYTCGQSSCGALPGHHTGNQLNFKMYPPTGSTFGQICK